MATAKFFTRASRELNKSNKSGSSFFSDNPNNKAPSDWPCIHINTRILLVEPNSVARILSSGWIFDEAGNPMENHFLITPPSSRTTHLIKSTLIGRSIPTKLKPDWPSLHFKVTKALIGYCYFTGKYRLYWSANFWLVSCTSVQFCHATMRAATIITVVKIRNLWKKKSNHHTIKAVRFVTPCSNSAVVSRQIGTKSHTHMQGRSCNVWRK